MSTSEVTKHKNELLFKNIKNSLTYREDSLSLKHNILEIILTVA